MFENIGKLLKKFGKNKKEESKNTAKERLHLVLAQDRANISADFLEMMKQEIIEVIKKYIDIDEKAIDVRMTNKQSEDGTVGAPSLYANIPIVTIKSEARKLEGKVVKEDNVNENVQKEEIKQDKLEEDEQIKKEEEITSENKKEETAKIQNNNKENESKKEENKSKVNQPNKKNSKNKKKKRKKA